MSAFAIQVLYHAFASARSSGNEYRVAVDALEAVALDAERSTHDGRSCCTFTFADGSRAVVLDHVGHGVSVSLNGIGRPVIMGILDQFYEDGQ